MPSYDEPAPMESWGGIDGPVMLCLIHDLPVPGEAYDNAACTVRCAWWGGAK